MTAKPANPFPKNFRLEIVGFNLFSMSKLSAINAHFGLGWQKFAAHLALQLFVRRHITPSWSFPRRGNRFLRRVALPRNTVH